MTRGEHAFGKPGQGLRLPAPRPAGPPSPSLAENSGAGRWLPAEGRPEPEAAAAGTRRLRAGGRRWNLVLLLAAAMLTGSFVLDTALDRAADQLLRTGSRTDGIVTSILEGTRAPYLMLVKYQAAGATRRAIIDRTSGRRYTAGDHVTVVYDPSRPERVRTTEEPNHDTDAVLLGGALLVAASGTFPVAVLRRIAWARRFHRARRTGWYPAVVTVAPHRRLAADDHHAPDLEIGYPDGTGITARAYRVAQLGDRPRRAAWAAGSGPYISVLFHHGPGTDKAYLVPAKAVTERGHRH